MRIVLMAVICLLFSSSVTRQADVRVRDGRAAEIQDLESTVTKRRAELRAKMYELVRLMNEAEPKEPSTLKYFLCATQNFDDKNDACVVIITKDKIATGLLFLFREGKWTVVSEDFK